MLTDVPSVKLTENKTHQIVHVLMENSKEKTSNVSTVLLNVLPVLKPETIVILVMTDMTTTHLFVHVTKIT
jgi:hypothetical protein